MPVPKWRHSRRRRDMRRKNIKLLAPVFTICSNCKNAIIPHRLCPYCGYYKGKEIIKIIKEASKEKEKKKKL